jgi:hypothetical protein
LTAEVRFSDIRSDWYAANTLLPRLFVNAIRARKSLTLIGFPAQWIVVAAHYGMTTKSAVAPKGYVPLISDLAVDEVERLAREANRHGSSRVLLESIVALDPVIADFVYMLDHKLAAAGLAVPASRGTNYLNTWHSFCRPEIVRLQDEMAATIAPTKSLLFLPCARQRPYDRSRTHKRIIAQLTELNVLDGPHARVVVTALGVIPQAYWNHSLVMTYNAGAVDLWRVFALLRRFLATNRPNTVVDCLSFKPYSQMLDTLASMGAVGAAVRPLPIRWRGFHPS